LYEQHIEPPILAHGDALDSSAVRVVGIPVTYVANEEIRPTPAARIAATTAPLAATVNFVHVGDGHCFVSAPQGSHAKALGRCSGLDDRTVSEF
jgi:hypothetical protein